MSRYLPNRRNYLGLFDDLFDEDFLPSNHTNFMRTDIEENENEYVFRQLTVKDGLSDNRVRNIGAANDIGATNDKTTKTENGFPRCEKPFDSETVRGRTRLARFLRIRL